MVMSGISAMPRVAQGVRRGFRPASKPASVRGRRFAAKRDFAGPEAFHFARTGAHNERTLIIDAGGDAGHGLGPLGDADRLAAEDVEALPQRGEFFAVVIVDETAVGGEDAGNERGGKAVDIDGGS